MKPLVFLLYGSKNIAEQVIKHGDYEMGAMEIRRFPDEEVYVRLLSDVRDRKVILIATLDRVDEKLLSLIFSAQMIKELGASEVGLIAPYLSYMRQDERFKEGEGITSKYFGKLLSSYFDWMITIDPHLHRRHSMDEIYTMPVAVLHAIEPITKWIKKNVPAPFMMGPDQESIQWVGEIAKNLDVPFVVAEKTRKGDREIETLIPRLDHYKNLTPVLVDDIISTGKTMLSTISQLKALGMKPPICIGVHAVFAEGAYDELCQSGAKVVTTNTIEHMSNQIDVSSVIVKYILSLREH